MGFKDHISSGLGVLMLDCEVSKLSGLLRSLFGLPCASKVGSRPTRSYMDRRSDPRGSKYPHFRFLLPKPKHYYFSESETSTMGTWTYWGSYYKMRISAACTTTWDVVLELGAFWQVRYLFLACLHGFRWSPFSLASFCSCSF